MLLIYVETSAASDYRQLEMAMRTYECRVCGHLYREAEGDPQSGIPPGTRWEDIPDDWTCPDCGMGKGEYALYEE